MPAPRKLARFNKRATNRILGPVVKHLPGFGVIVHTGRRSGQVYRTPVAAFRRSRTFTKALTYGPDTDRVRNVVASRECELETGRQAVTLGKPRVYRDEQRSAVPMMVRIPLRLMRVADFIELRQLDATPG